MGIQSPQGTPKKRASGGNFALTTLALATAVTVVLSAILSGRTVIERPPGTATATPQPTPTLITSLPTPFQVAYTGRSVAEGQSIFQSTCSGCHGQAAQGIPGLG